MRWQNWGRTVSAEPTAVEAPGTADEVRTIVSAAVEAGTRVKAVGSGHSFSAIAEPEDTQLTLDRLSGLISVDVTTREVTLGAGTRLRAIPAILEPYGLAMENLGDIDAQTLAGAISSGTHGTGSAFRGIAAQVTGVVLVTGSGELLRVDAQHNAHLLPAVSLGLGALGILVEVTIQCVEAFDLHAVERTSALSSVLGSLEEQLASADHFEFFWFPHTDRALTKVNTRLGSSERRAPLSTRRKWFDETVMANGVFRASCALGRVAPASIPTLNRTAARLSGERTFADASARVFTTRRTVRFTEMEYAIPAEQALEAFAEVRSLIERERWRISFPVEVRFAAADELWLSTAYGRATAYIAVHRVLGEDPQPYFRAVEAIMRARGGRPHWGKMHWREAADLAASYPRFEDFLAARSALDPAGVFSNPYLRRVLG